MHLSREDVRSIAKLMLFAAGLVFVIIYFRGIVSGAAFVAEIFMPFVIGGIIAFILNIPMVFFERRIEQYAKKRFKGIRACSLLSAILAVIAVLAFVMIIVIPQLAETISEIAQVIPNAAKKILLQLERIFSENPQMLEQLSKLQGIEFNWGNILRSVTNFLKTGFVDVITTTYLATGSIVGFLFDFFISFVFAIYILVQKETLQRQFLRLFKAFLSAKAYQRTNHVLGILYFSFKNYITGQCLEAVILGSMFVVVMTVSRLPYALLIGVLIGVTALIPIVGAFIGCAVGVFLILMVSPVKALIFLCMFLVLQQIEGNLIYPRVVGNSVGLPAIWVLMAVSIGGSLMGVAGMLAFIPLTSTAYALLREGVQEREAKARGIKAREN